MTQETTVQPAAAAGHTQRAFATIGALGDGDPTTKTSWLSLYRLSSQRPSEKMANSAPTQEPNIKKAGRSPPPHLTIAFA